MNIQKTSQYFPKSCEPFEGDINVKVDLPNYATKVELKNTTGIDTFKLAAKSDLSSLKNVDKIDVQKLKTVLIDLSKLSNVANNEVVKKFVYNKLVEKVNNIDTSEFFVLETKYQRDKSDLEKKISATDKKIPDTSGLIKKEITILILLK